jgi:hypothetical protein
MTIYWSTTHCAFPFDHGSKRTAGQIPLSGIRVIELGNFIAAPFASHLLAEFGVDFIKVEPPGASELVIVRISGCLANSPLRARRSSLQARWGNVCTEDVVHMFDQIGGASSVDLAALLTLAKGLPTLLEHDVPGQVVKAGRYCSLYPVPAGL